MKNKKGQVFDNLAGLAVGIATFAIIMVVAFLVIGNTQEQTVDIDPCADGYTVNGTGCCLDASYGDGTCFGANQTGYNSDSYESTVTLQSAAEDVPGWVPLVV